MEIKHIFIHGWSFDKNIWKDYFNIKNALFLDLPSHGKNKEYKSLQDFSLQIANIINSQKEKVNLIGWSIGATVSFLTALQTENIDKLILIGFSPKFNDINLGSNPKFIKAFLINLQKDFENTIYNFRKNATSNEFRDIKLPEKEGSIKLLKDFINIDLTEKFLNKKAFIIHGKDDIIVNPNATLFCKNIIKEPVIYLINSNHAPFLENKDLIKDLIIE